MSHAYDRSYFAREYFELHAGKRRYLEYLVAMLRRHQVASGRVLDVGAAYGFFLDALERAGYAPCGLEHALPAAARALRRDRLVVADAAAAWPLREGSFEAVTLLDVIEHLHDPGAVLRASHAALRPGGRLFVLTLNAWSLARPLLGRQWSYHLDPTHVRLYSPPRLRQTLAGAGFAVRRMRTLFNFCTVGEGNRALLPLRRIGRVIHVPFCGDSMLAVAERV